MGAFDIKKLAEIAVKPARTIIGLMSGTSLDGLDIAFCRFAGSGRTTKVDLLEYETIPYNQAFIADIRSVFAKDVVSLEKVCLLNPLIADIHAEMILSSLEKWGLSPNQVDCIASHGQTIYHSPQRLHKLADYPNGTLQIGDGDHLAVRTGIITISDFRQKHVAAGGEGAPLALYGDYVLFSSPVEGRILLNIGGISNFTFLPSGDASKIISTDAGPGNTLIDALARKYFNQPYDKDGSIALSGSVNESLLASLLDNPFFNDALPKTTGPELFNLDYVEKSLGVLDIEPRDLLATVTELTAFSIAKTIKSLGISEPVIYASGGGARNPAILKSIHHHLPNVPIKNLTELGINPDAKEAILFALLANECLAGSGIQLGKAPAITMGKISLPS